MSNAKKSVIVAFAVWAIWSALAVVLVIHLTPSPSPHHYPKVYATVTKVGPLEESEPDSTTTRPVDLVFPNRGIQETLHRKLDWRTQVGEKRLVTLGPKGPWLKGDEASNPNNPPSNAPRTVFLVLFILLGVVPFVLAGSEVENRLERGKRILPRRPKLPKLPRRLPKAQAHLLKLDKELSKKKTTYKVTKTRENIALLLKRMDEQEKSKDRGDDARVDVIANTVDKLLEDHNG